MRHIPALAALAVLGSLSLSPAVASADNKAWTAAKENLPDTAFAVNVDVQAVAKSSIYAALLPMLLGKAEVKAGVDMIKSECKIDPLTVITNIVVAGSSEKNNGAVYLALPGFGQKKAVACLQAMGAAASKGKDTLTVKTDGNIVQLDDGKDTIFIGFIGEVAVIAPTQVHDKAGVKAWMSGAGAFGKGALGKLIAKADKGSAVFGASTEVKTLADTTMGAKDFVGWVSLTSGNLALELHADYADAAAAKTVVTTANKQVDQLRQNPPLPALGAILKGLSITVSGAEATVKAAAAEKDILDLVKLALGTMH